MGLRVRLKCLKNEIKLTFNLPKVFGEIKQVLREEQLWTGLERKSYLRRLLENVWWYLKNKEACIYYNSYGFDIKNFRDKRDYLPYREFRIQRFCEDYPVNIYESKLFLLRNKIAFSAYFQAMLGKDSVVGNVALIDENGGLFDFRTNQSGELGEFLSSEPKLYFAKKINGECGEGCFLLDNSSDTKDILKRMHGSQFLIQEKLAQHQLINLINPSCINTIRIITIIGKHSKMPRVFAHYIRVGCNSINDNRATGGVGVGIDERGVMLKYGVGHHRVETQHSVTGYSYEGTEIPFWNEVKDLVIKAHAAIKEIPTIGWDVALTPNGPVLIEGNDNWEISGAQDTVGGLKAKWYEMHK